MLAWKIYRICDNSAAMINSMIFFPEKQHYEKPADYGYVYEDVALLTQDQVKLHGWYLHALGSDSSSAGLREEEGVILFFHGNAGNISNRLSKVKGWIEKRYSVLLIDYRSYGQSEGKIESQEDILYDAEAALKWLLEVKKIDSKKIVFYGESLGSFPAVTLATKYSAKALILEAPFTSFVELAKIHYSFLPQPMLAGLLKHFEFSNLRLMDQLKCPLFILHGTRDEICPYAMSEKLFEKVLQPKSHFTIENGAHNDLPMVAGADYWDQPGQFLEKIAVR